MKNKKQKNVNITLLILKKTYLSSIFSIILIFALYLTGNYYLTYKTALDDNKSTIQSSLSIENTRNEIITYTKAEVPKKLKGKKI